MIEIIVLAAAGAATVIGYLKTRRFVRERLRFVDSAHWRGAPIVAGVAAALLAAPVVWLLPYIGAGSALVFGLGVAGGVRAGARDHERLPPS